MGQTANGHRLMIVEKTQSISSVVDAKMLGGVCPIFILGDRFYLQNAFLRPLEFCGRSV